MKITREIQLKDIAEKLGVFANVVALNNGAGFYDINKSSEELFIKILNIAYNLNLRNLNVIQDNYPAIDLGDHHSKICVQVTSNATNDKFKHTIEKFFSKNLNHVYETIIFLVISTTKSSSLNDDRIKTEVINLVDLNKKISYLPDADIQSIHGYLSQSLKPRQEQSTSILPSTYLPQSHMPYPRGLIEFLQFNSDALLIDQLKKDLQVFAKTLVSLTINQREYLFYVVCNGQLTRFEERIVITTSEVDQQFGKISLEIYNVLMSKGLLGYDDEYEPECDGRYLKVIYPRFRGVLDDTNLFCVFKQFCSNDDSKLKQILIDCNFSCLA